MTAPVHKGAEATAEALGRRPFLLALLGLCGAYFALELFYISRLQLVMDEFQGGYAVHQLRTSTPYVDFTPYKTVLGYYLQLPALWFGDDIWSQLMRIKQWTALMVAAGLWWAGYLLSLSFRRHAVLLGMGSLLCVSTFLERSAALRVDMLTSLVGFISLALLFRHRPVWAGLTAGVAFLVSQKAAYFCLAGGVALGSYWLVCERSRERFRDAAAFSIAALFVIAAYVSTFVLFGAGETAAHATVWKPQALAFDVMYQRLSHYWMQTITRNPYFYSVAVLGIGVAFEASRGHARRREWIVWTYAGTVLACCLWHRQPWPYFFVLLLPTLAVPCMLVFERVARSRAWLFWSLFVLLGVLYPLQRVQVVAARDQGYQRYSVRLAERLLAPADTYLAGIHIIYTREQSPKRLGWLDKQGVGWVKQGHVGSMSRALDKRPPKLLFWTYRLTSLPPRLTLKLRRRYRHLSGGIWIYSPTVEQKNFRIGYTGDYRVDGPKGTVYIDGKLHERGEVIRLRAGWHHANQPGFRLRWMLDDRVRDSLDERYHKRQKFFDAVYEY